ncbi:MAG: GAF domain-containing protein, partial [Pseudolabrys sp.]
LADPGYAHELALAGGWRASIAVPMLRHGKPVGAISVGKAEAGPFSERQMQLLGTFADQAVIAIENARLFDEVQARTRDLFESLEQQTATSEVLKVVSSSTGKLEPVFDAMLQNAVRICGAQFGNLMLREGDAFRLGATHGAPQAYVDYLHNNQMFRTNPGLAQLVKTKEHYHLADIAAAPTFGDELREATVHLAGARTLIGVPMLKDDKVIGAIIIYRQEVRPFTNKQIELVKNFAAQAVIAIENTRLLNELRESLQQQTATADVLKVISSSTGELQPVFKTMLAKAVERCEASFGAMWLVDGEGYRTAAMHGDLSQAYVEQWRSGTLHLPKTDIPMVRAIRSRKTVHTPDMRKEKAYLEGDPLAVSAADIGGIRTLVTVPMLKEGEAVGVITIYRREVLPFNQKQIELVENFAAQAVIAIENTRLLNELRESLQQQTATADVLKVISRSPGQLEPVFKAMLENAVRICEAKFGILFLSEGDAFRTVALHGAPPAYAEARWREPVFRPNPGMASGRVARTKQPVQIADIRAEPAYTGDPQRFAILELAGARTMLNVPMLKEDELVGQIAIYRQEVRPFTDKQIELLTNFAAQAVIAIENARLLKELRESLQQQTATADVLKVIS